MNTTRQSCYNKDKFATIAAGTFTLRNLLETFLWLNHVLKWARECDAVEILNLNVPQPSDQWPRSDLLADGRKMLCSQ